MLEMCFIIKTRDSTALFMLFFEERICTNSRRFAVICDVLLNSVQECCSRRGIPTLTLSM